MSVFCLLEPVYVPFLIVGSIFIAFIILGSLVAIYCCTCLRPKEPSQQPIRFSLRSYQTETLPMILTSTSLRAPSRQSSTATSSSSTGGSVRRFSFARPEPGCLVPSSPPPYSTGHAIHLTQPSGFLVSPQYFAYPLQQEPPLPGKSCPDFSSSWRVAAVTRPVWWSGSQVGCCYTGWVARTFEEICGTLSRSWKRGPERHSTFWFWSPWLQTRSDFANMVNTTPYSSFVKIFGSLMFRFQAEGKYLTGQFSYPL